MSRQNTFFGKPGSGSGIVQPIDWRLGAQAGQSIGGALAQMGAQGGEVMKTKAVQKNLGDKARKALKLFKDDLELDDSDIDAYSRAEAEGVLAQVPMMYKRWAEQDTADYRDRQLDISQQQTDAIAALRGAQSEAFKADAKRQGTFTQALQAQIADAHDVVKNKNYFLSQKGKKKGDWDKQATDEEKAAVKFFNSPVGQLAFRGTELTFDQMEKMDLMDTGVELNTVRDPDTGATVFTFGNQMRVVEPTPVPVKTSSVQHQDDVIAQVKSGNFLGAANQMGQYLQPGLQLGGEDRDQLMETNPTLVRQQERLQLADRTKNLLPNPALQKQFISAFAVIAYGQEVDGMDRDKAYSDLQAIGDTLFTPQANNQQRKEWFQSMGVQDPLF